jgi:hypothetical protein
VSISDLRILADQESDKIINLMKSDSAFNYHLHLQRVGDEVVLAGYPPDADVHRGLYGIRFSKGDRCAVAYIGKTENNNRVLHHVLGVNKNGTDLANPLGNKNHQIRRAIATGFDIQLCLFRDPDLDKPTLACIEIACIQKAMADFKIMFPDLDHWNRRVG